MDPPTPDRRKMMWLSITVVICVLLSGKASAVTETCQCESPNRVCFVAYPEDCKKFIFCIQGKPHIRRCAFGTFFDPERSLCTFSAEVSCASDPCVLKPSLESYFADDGHCKHYWRCLNGVSTPACCAEGMAYGQASESCVSSPKDKCKDKCEVGPPQVSEGDTDTPPSPQDVPESTPETTAESGCKLRTVRNNGRAFYHVDRVNEPQMCPDGTRFSEEACVCVDSRYKPTCKLEVHISFSKSDGKIENRATSLFIGHENLDIVRGFGFFKGVSQINVPFYSGNDNLSRKFGFQIRLYPLEGKSDGVQTLLSNCDSTKGHSSSLEIKLDPVEGVMRYRAMNAAGDWTELVLPYKVRIWTNVLFIFSGTDLQAMLQYVDPDTNNIVEEVQKRSFTDKLKVSPGPLRVGGCSGVDGVQAFVDEIAVSFCKMDFPEKP